MSSKLYQFACATLSKEDRQCLQAFGKWLKRVRKTGKGDPVDGAQLLANLKNEAHLVGGAPFGDAAALSVFLADCGAKHRVTKGIKKRAEQYGATCGTHAAKGLPIPTDHLPPRLLRYCTSSYAAELIIERVLGKLARKEFASGRLSPDDAFRRVASRWDASRMTDAEKLAGWGLAWATFKYRKGTPRYDARRMAQALALPASKDAILLEFSYRRDDVTGHRFPTVADAGYFHQFRPACEVPPDPERRRTCWGFTKPTGVVPGQPEIVHDNASLRVLRRAPRFVGRIV